MIKYFQEGGAMDAKQQMQQMFMSYLSQKYNTDDINTLIQKLQSTPGEQGETKLEDEMIEFKQVLQQQQGEPQMAKDGTKLNYLKQLRGQCPEGTELKYFKEGGTICSKCVKAQDGIKTKKPQKQYFKKETVNFNDTVHTADGKAKSLTDYYGKRIDRRFPAYSTKDYQADLKGKNGVAGRKRAEKQDLITAEKCGGKARMEKCGGKTKMEKCGGKAKITAEKCGGKTKMEKGKKLSKKCKLGGILYFT